MLTKQEITLLISSNPNAGAQNLSANGDAFQITLSEPIKVPKNAQNVNLTVLESNIWNTVPNVSAALGNNTVSGSINSNAFTITLPDGIYSLPQLSTTIDKQLQQQLGGAYTSGQVSFIADTATSTVILKSTVANTVFNFNAPSATGLATLLGFDFIIVSNGASVPYFYQTTTRALLNNINYFLIHSDLTSQGESFNGTFSQIIAKAPITEGPNELVNYEPRHPSNVDCSDLAGANTKSTIRFWLTDDSNNPVAMSEYWGCRITLTWEVPLALKTADGNFI